MVSTKKLKYNRRTFFLYSIVLLLLGLCATAHSSSQLDSIARKPTIDIFFLPSGQGWVVSSDWEKSYLFRTDDGGRRWTKLALQIPLERIFFLDSEHGWGIAGTQEAFQLVSTIDGGRSWRQICLLPELSPPGITVTQILFASQERGWVLATRPKGIGVVLQVEERGSAITKISTFSDRRGLVNGIFATPDGQNVWIVGNSSIIYTPDSGASWLEQVTQAKMPARRKAIAFTAGWALKSGKVFVVGQSAGGVILSSNDLGKNWTLVAESDKANSFTDLAFWDERHGCAVGFSALLFCTNDSGSSWEAAPVLPPAQNDMVFMDNIFQRVVFIENGTRGWVVASGGFLLETDDSGRSWHKVDLFEATND